MMKIDLLTQEEHNPIIANDTLGGDTPTFIDIVAVRIEALKLATEIGLKIIDKISASEDHLSKGKEGKEDHLSKGKFEEVDEDLDVVNVVKGISEDIDIIHKIAEKNFKYIMYGLLNEGDK